MADKGKSLRNFAQMMDDFTFGLTDASIPTEVMAVGDDIWLTPWLVLLEPISC